MALEKVWKIREQVLAKQQKAQEELEEIEKKRNADTRMKHAKDFLPKPDPTLTELQKQGKTVSEFCNKRLELLKDTLNKIQEIEAEQEQQNSV